MPWIQLTITTDNEHARSLGDILMANGAQAVTYRDAEDAPIFEPSPGEVPLWEQTQVTGLYPAETDLNPVLGNLANVRFLSQPVRYKTDQLEDKDWEREWMDNFKPICFANKLWVVPTWHEIPEPGKPALLLDPGMAFGTGTHPTTALCLEWLAQQPMHNATVVDFGCGSGILGIAALKLGANYCMGTDIDQQALIASRDNAKLNHVADKMAVHFPEQAPDLQADVVIANILAGPLQELSDIILSYLKPGGKIILSGILERQCPDVMAAYEDSIQFEPPRFLDEWSLLAGTKLTGTKHD